MFRSRPALTTKLARAFTLVIAALSLNAAGVIQTQTAHAVDANPFEQEVVRLLNQERAALGRPALVPEARLWAASEGHAEWMASVQVMSHIGLNGGGPVERGISAGYTRYTIIGEAVAQGYTTPAAVVAGWKASPPHWKLLSDARFRDIGIGYVLGGGRAIHWWAADVGNSSDAPWPLGGGPPSAPAQPSVTTTPVPKPPTVKPPPTSEPKPPTSLPPTSAPKLPTSAPPPTSAPRLPTSAPTAIAPGGIRGRALAEFRPSSSGIFILIDGTTRAVTNVSGFFELVNVAPGRHTVEARLTGYLSRRASILVNPNARLDLGATNLRAGDVVADNKVDLRDLISVSGAVGRCLGQPGYQPLFDLNQSTCITSDDVNILRRNYGLTGPMVWGP